MTMMAFLTESKDDAKLTEELIRMLETEPVDRSEWNLQR